MDIDKLKDELRRDEGYRDRPYKCTAGAWTIGYGHNLSARGYSQTRIDNMAKHGISRELAERWLIEDIEQAMEDVREWCQSFDSLSEVRQRALANFSFNLGLGKLKQFKRTLAAIEAGDYERAAECMEESKWYGQVGERAKRLCEMMRQG